jgi:hypothetical protein
MIRNSDSKTASGSSRCDAAITADASSNKNNGFSLYSIIYRDNAETTYQHTRMYLFVHSYVVYDVNTRPNCVPTEKLGPRKYFVDYTTTLASAAFRNTWSRYYMILI